jgi:hypothetical protein
MKCKIEAQMMMDEDIATTNGSWPAAGEKNIEVVLNMV